MEEKKRLKIKKYSCLGMVALIPAVIATRGEHTLVWMFLINCALLINVGIVD
jgi:hypothetical protein